MLLNKIYYYNNDYSKPINISVANNSISVNSTYQWKQDFGKIIDSHTILFQKLGKATFTSDKLIFSQHNFWHIDNRKNILLIGANNMQELFNLQHCGNLPNKYKNGFFIEPIFEKFEELKKNLQIISAKYNCNYQAINQLITSQDNKEYDFNIFSNNGASSSIFKPTNLAIQEWNVKVIDTIKLKSITINTLLQQIKWENTKYDLVIDVQGAELEVLSGYNPDYLQFVDYIIVEASQKEYYKNGVLYHELNNFLINKGFSLLNPMKRNHGDIVYVRS